MKIILDEASPVGVTQDLYIEVPLKFGKLPH